MRVLCLDYGSARCGLAISDPTRTLATPLPVVKSPDQPAGMQKIADVVSNMEASLVVVGLPILPSGGEGDQARATRSFVGRLRKMIACDVELYDERFTTQLAARSQREGAQAEEDSVAAAHLLLSYFQANKQQQDDLPL